jgi:ribonuclease-3
VNHGGLEERLGHRFRDRGLLDRALTHRSAGAPNNERLEFLGDAVLGFLVAERLFGHFPNAREGTLTRLRAAVVKGESLADRAREMELGPHLRLGSGERKSGGRDRDSILADGLEALIGAALLDGGETAARAVVDHLFGPVIRDLDPDAVIKDPKTRLQEWLQGRGLALPDYELLEATGTDHARTFRVRCTVPQGTAAAEAIGASRRRAEQRAAASVLAQLEGGPA